MKEKKSNKVGKEYFIHMIHFPSILAYGFVT